MKLHKPLSITVLLSFLFSILLLSPPSYAVIRTVEGTVSKISDGDTLHVATPEGTKLKVRLYGCDAPETEKMDRRTGQTSMPGQPYGEESFLALQSKVYRKNVRLDIIDIDRYRRMVSMIWLGNRNINLEMIREGHAEAYRKYLKEPYQSQFINAEKQARAERAGIWGLSDFERPSEFRKRMRIRGY
ncbi:MAG: Thermonuclease precursor [Syntrophus sp. PtaB.Bin075]|nr:MAG: Thermonuclease precursor [Syntrophus sp. PtaB.Bin075]